ncbi:1,4-dihydroxy-2-naphthoate polyprenyltransferase [Microcella flavibacter]|uniref:1,4-dihydroxy-2-naphthoate polyprenyltransferase n=1 Tax=Microcella flavibacter TaxID=1804990 RepID=UPI0014564FDF|nr:1,4-dihydroxy-2-naphthoate polyprenyltransferase [Microcella flavibacter]
MAPTSKKKPRTRSGNPARSGDPASRSTKAARSGNPAAASRATARDWIAGARLRTLTLAISPVALGTAIAFVTEGYDLGLALLCLALAVFLQIGVNYANDYSDGVRGTDAVRVGPRRLTGGGLAPARTVLIVALVFFGLGAAAGLAVVVLSGQYWLLIVGAIAIAAAWFYTGGKKPYGYSGFGELVAFLFFGPVAVIGTTYVQIGEMPLDAVIAGVIAGLFAAAVMLVNNIRDIEQDGVAAKRTLAVRLGDRAARILFGVLLLVAFGLVGYFCVFYVYAPYVYFALLLAAPVVLIVLTARTAAELVLALKMTSAAALVTGASLAAAIAF